MKHSLEINTMLHKIRFQQIYSIHSHKLSILIGIFLLCNVFSSGSVVATNVSVIDATFKMPEHPRLLLSESALQQLKSEFPTHSLLNELNQLILTESEQIISLPDIPFQVKGGQLLFQTREALRRVLYLSYAYRISDKDIFAQKAEEELLKIAAFGDWNKGHFLVNGELTFTLALGYDWLYGYLPAKSKDSIEMAIQHYGFEPLTNDKINSWKKDVNNCNQVCNAGLVAGEIVFWENNPTLAASVINQCVNSVKLPMQEYIANGAYPEGYMYWGYGTTYNVILLDILQSILGNDGGLTAIPGFLNTGSFIQNMEGLPTQRFSIPMKTDVDTEKFTIERQCFNYSDCISSTEVNPCMFWFARNNKDESILWNEIQKLNADLKSNKKELVQNRFTPFMMIWKPTSATNIQPPENKMYVGAGSDKIAVATMRTSWTDENGIFVGIKGGSIDVGHSHMDIGSFVMESEGVRWAMDLGLQSYTPLQNKVDLWHFHQEAQRWDVFRYNNLAHNTLTLNQHKQLVTGFAGIEASTNKPNLMAVSMDLTSFYKNDVDKARRSVGIVDDKFVLIQDEINSGNGSDTIRWNMVTTAKVTLIDNKTIQLTQAGKMLTLILIADNVKVESKVWSTQSPNDYDVSNKGTQFVGFEVYLPAGAKKLLNTWLIPGKIAKSDIKAYSKLKL